MLPNHTRNQHFVSGVEQKLNANPQAADRNLRIYSSAWSIERLSAGVGKQEWEVDRQ
jgi:hypothetical protein